MHIFRSFAPDIVIADIGLPDADGYELVKPMSYPLFLAFVSTTGLPYTLALLLLWLLAATSVAAMIRSLGIRNRFALLAVFVYVLYCPTAFDAGVGTRMYRNAVIAPVV